MRFDLDFDDRLIIHYFVENNILTQIEAVVYTLVFTRPIGRDRQNVANLLILYRYEQLTSVDEINAAIESLIKKNFFKEVKQGNSSRIECVDPVNLIEARKKTLVAGEEEDKVINVIRLKGQGVQDYLIENIGWANSKYASDTYFQALFGASKTIKLPVFSFATHGRVRDYIMQAVERGVHVKILMYSPELALKAHGVGRDEEVRNSLHEWNQILKKYGKSLGKIEIRLIKDQLFGYLAGALLVDEQLFRYDIYYPRLQRGHEGFIIQGKPYQGETSNLYHVMNYYFDSAWQSAARLNPLLNFYYGILEWGPGIVGVFLIFLGFLTIKGFFPVFNEDKSNYGLFFITLGLFPALSGLKLFVRWLSRFEIRIRR